MEVEIRMIASVKEGGNGESVFSGGSGFWL